MWKLIQHVPNIHNTFRYALLKNCNGIRSNFFQTTKNHVTNAPKTHFKPIFTFPKITVIGIAIASGAVVQIVVHKNTALCEKKGSRMAGYRKSSDKHLKFDWKLFWLYVRPHIWYLIAAIVGALAVALLNIAIPQVMGGVINVLAKFNESKDSQMFISEMKLPAIKLVSMYLAQSCCTFFYIVMLSNLGEKIAFNMKVHLFASILRQDIGFFDEQRTGEIINRLTTDIQDFKSSFKQTVSGGLRASAQIVGCSASLLMISPQMTFVSLLCIPSIIFVGTVFGSLLRVISRRAQAQVEKTTAVADEAVGNIRTVRAFAMEEQELELFENEALKALVLNETLGFGIGLFQAGTNLFLNGMVLATLYMGGYLLSTNQLSAGEVMAFLMASQTIQRSLAQISLLFGSVVRGAAAGARIFEYIKMEPTIPLKFVDHSPWNVQGDIKFNDVTFAYPSRPQQNVLQNFNLTVPAGKTVAIVGASGNGKSTIVALLERFYDVKGGSITLDGRDIRTLDPSKLRGKTLGLISQEPVLFGTSILENIRYGRPEATDQEVREAAILANADEFISYFPKGYDTLVGERGVTLSGGQKQRIAIARALLKFPSVLLLDEATSALDTESEKIVQEALEKARRGRTVIVIAHRLSTIQNADIIVVLHKGKIVETGTHESLKKLRGYYWSLVYQQENSPAA
ncbi:ATP-binding cassette sub-family B member 8, mitochondrial [Anoplophora glabripennis]|uniref:ATP-binding cassette sub-family B member 8, mitochondrial n=1 Tax=Anoplophora glabripennis TaxID=217634 RepID=UPI0008750F54|nr:ATP-binding cassette sub-family B member 8, mitochondrial [Anoplophora glabripennis]